MLIMLELSFRESKLCEDEPVPIVKLRAESKNVTAFDKSLESLINLYTKQPEFEYPDGEINGYCQVLFKIRV